ncbi:MAG: SIMPL domain-containing protein [Deltaproteobacteria bacterium]|nr:SIMPL domain-containing protein [Deltaproteobacteria bacterium]
MRRFLFIIAFFTIMPILAFAQQPSYANEKPKITVTGEAVVKVTPDKVTILLGVETWDKEIQKAKQKNNDLVNKTLKAIKKAGVKEKNLQTDHLSIEPRYKSGYSKKDFIGYFVRNTISATLTQPDKLETLITGVLTAGVTHIHGITFATTQFKKHREQARKLALEAAREKGEKMAAVFGKKIGDPIQISEHRQYSHYYGSWWGYGRGQAMSQNVVQNRGGQSDDMTDTIALGKISVKGSVTVVFELH